MDDSPLCCLGNNLAHLMPSSGCHPHHHLLDAVSAAPPYQVLKALVDGAWRCGNPVTVLCDVLGASPAGYYAWRSRPESRRCSANRDLVDDIKQVHRDTHGH